MMAEIAVDVAAKGVLSGVGMLAASDTGQRVLRSGLEMLHVSPKVIDKVLEQLRDDIGDIKKAVEEISQKLDALLQESKTRFVSRFFS